MYSFLAPTYVFDEVSYKMGVAFYHPTPEVQDVMLELYQCLNKEASFKDMNQDTLVPPLVINTFHERSAYTGWLIALLSIFFCVVLAGCAVEAYQNYVRNKKKRKMSIVMDLTPEKL